MVTEIGRDELKQKLNHPKKLILVEALPSESYERAHLPGALNLPPEQVRTLATELMPRKDFEVIVYCAGPSVTLLGLSHGNCRKWATSMCVVMWAVRRIG
jgi:rhodanese-related sulfurtransferase